MRLLKFLPLFCFTAALSFAQSIPAVKAKALDNSEVNSQIQSNSYWHVKLSCCKSRSASSVRLKLPDLS
jgi:hypothetical protein